MPPTPIGRRMYKSGMICGKTAALRKLSGDASAIKEPGHFEVTKSSSQVTRMHFSSKKLTTFLFFVYTITEAKQYTGGARAVDLPAMSLDLARCGVATPLGKLDN